MSKAGGDGDLGPSVLSRPSVDRTRPCVGEGVVFTESTASNAPPFPGHPHRHPQKCSPMEAIHGTEPRPPILTSPALATGLGGGVLPPHTCPGGLLSCLFLESHLSVRPAFPLPTSELLPRRK